MDRPEQFLFYVNDSTVENGITHTPADSFEIYGGIVVFHVSYQSSIDEKVHCTADAYRLRGSKNQPIMTVTDMMVGKFVCDTPAQSIEASKIDQSGGYAD